MAAGKTIRAAAETVGVSERTANRRAADPAFRKKVSTLRDGMTVAALGRLGDGLALAADTLRELVKSEDEHVRLKAAVKVFELTLRLREHVELSERLRALEAAQDARESQSA